MPSVFGRVRASPPPLSRAYLSVSAPAQCDPVRERVVYADLVRPGGRCRVIRMDGDAEAAPKTTTISTIAVQSGSTRIVIALLQVGISLSTYSTC